MWSESENATEEQLGLDSEAVSNESGYGEAPESVLNDIMSVIEMVQSLAVLVGLAGNVLNVVILVRMCRHLRSRRVYDNSAMVMLMLMSAVDLFTLALQLPFVVHDWKLADFCLAESNAYYECFVWYPFSQFGVTAIALLSVVISLDRFAAVRDLHAVQNAFRRRSGLITAVTLLVALLFHVPRYFEKHVILVTNLPPLPAVAYTCDQTEFHNTHAAQLTMLTVTVNAFVPMLVVVALGAGVIHALLGVGRFRETACLTKHHGEARASLATKLVVATMVVFSIWALLVLATAVVMLVQGADTFFKSDLGFLIGKLCNMIACVKSSVSFLLYCGTCAEYRACLRQLLTCSHAHAQDARAANNEAKRFLPNNV